MGPRCHATAPARRKPVERLPALAYPAAHDRHRALRRPLLRRTRRRLPPRVRGLGRGDRPSGRRARPSPAGADRPGAARPERPRRRVRPARRVRPRRGGAQASDAPPACDALDLLDCSCGIGTQAIGLARRGHQVCAGDISAAAVTRARGEARSRGVALRVAAVADMRQLPFREASFDAVICADNSLPHLLTEDDVPPRSRGIRRVLRPSGMLVLTVRPYDADPTRAPRLHCAPHIDAARRTAAVTFQRGTGTTTASARPRTLPVDPARH